MSATETSIANSALSKLGSARIISLNDDTREALLLKEQYPKIRDELLRSHPWNFAIKRVLLAPLTTTPAFGFSKMFQVPVDCLRVLTTDCPPESWEREGDKIVSDLDSIGIKYVARIVTPGSFDACFCEVLATLLAADVCFALTQSTSLKDSLDKQAEKKLRTSRSFDGQEGGPTRTYAREWLNSRY